MTCRSIFTYLIVAATFIMATAFSSVSNNGDSINVRDSNNLKQGWWKVHNADGKYKGYEAEQLVEEGEYVNNKKTGVWTKYFPNSNKKHELTFANNIANGYAKIYYRNGHLQEEGVWKFNRWSGQYKYYYDNGNMKYDWSYNNSGKREGEQKYFHENGVVQYVGDWKGGKEAGELTEFHEDGSVKAKRYFDNGTVQPEKTVSLVAGKEFDERAKMYSGKAKPKKIALGYLVDGYNKMMNADGTVSKEGAFKDKKLVDGKVYVYEGGKLTKTLIYQSGKRTGEEVAP
ncbi:MAG: antitoxin component YwqK of YwqJK toxin-antitoxin module [Bacteroidia bacterium]|jgi:antitoxin component YwqK of YwqJK toxin-antitoxin module